MTPAHTGRDHKDPALVHWGETTVPGGMVVASALGSALLYAVAAVTQQRAAYDQPLERSLRISLLINLLRRPLWLVGLTCGRISQLRRELERSWKMFQGELAVA